MIPCFLKSCPLQGIGRLAYFNKVIQDNPRASTPVGNPHIESFNGSFLIVAGRNINGNNSRASTFNSVIFFASNNVTFTDTTGGNNITGTAIAGNAIQIGRNDTFTYSAALLAAFPVIPSSGAYSSKNWIFQ